MIITNKEKCIKYLEMAGIDAYEENGRVFVIVGGYDDSFSLELTQEEINYRAELFNEMYQDMLLNSPNIDKDLIKEVKEGEKLEKVSKKITKTIECERIYYLTEEEMNKFLNYELKLDDIERYDEFCKDKEGEKK